MAGTVQRQANELSRRTLLAGAATVAGIGAAVAQQPAPAPRVKGPLVWLDLDQKELDDAYDQSKIAPNLAQIVKRYATNSDAVRARLGSPKRLSYGTTPIEGADLYPAKRPNAPVHVFIHGGAWRTGSAQTYAFQAETFVHMGFADFSRFLRSACVARSSPEFTMHTERQASSPMATNPTLTSFAETGRVEEVLQPRSAQTGCVRLFEPAP